MIRAVIIDDEINSIENLQWKLERYCPEVEVLAVFTDPVEAIAYLRKESPDLLFLDIEMPLMTGFDVLEELGPDVSFDVIFVTAYDTFGIKAIKFSALDYILKPVHNKELVQAVTRYSSGKKISGTGLTNLFENLDAERKKLPGRIALASRESIEFVSPEDIIACEADSNYTNVYMTDGTKRVISKTLKDFEEILESSGFFRTHLSFVVNLGHVKEFQRGDGGYLVMDNQMNVPVSKNRKNELLNLLGG